MSEKSDYVEAMIQNIIATEESLKSGANNTGDYDDMMPNAVDCVIQTGIASTATIQKELKVGYARASRMIDDMEQLGIVGPHQGAKPRKILITKDEWAEKRDELFSPAPSYTIAENSKATELVLPPTYIKDLPYSDSLKTKLYRYVDQVKAQNFTYCNCALIGCPFIEAVSIIPAIAGELGVNNTFETTFYPDFLKDKVSKLPDRSVFGYCTLGEIKQDDAEGLNKAMLFDSIFVTTGYGREAQTQVIHLPKWLYIVCVEKKSDIPIKLREGLYKEIDLTENAIDFRMKVVKQALDKYGLTVENDNILWEITRMCPQDDMIPLKVIEIRNRAYEDGTTVISEKHLSDSYGKVEGLDAVDRMEGREFEIFTGNLLRGNGFTNIHVTPSSGDFGADVIAEKDSVKYAIQCKRYSSPVGVSAVQEVIASKSLHDCHIACVLTNSTYTPAAVELAKKNLVILWDRAKLKEFIDRASANG